ncbi:MAG: YibE/F family protein [Firmicutes bacterium]|nr:YibE/F family protein [Bacillota bacterium]
MKFMLDKRFILLAALVLILVGGFAVLYAAEADETGDGQADLSGFQQEVLVKGKVVKIISEDEIIDPLSQNPVMNQILKVRIDSGRYKGKEIAVINYQTDNPVFNLKISEGDGVIVALEMDRENDKIKEAYIADHLRQDELYLLLLIFVVLVLAIGWRKGAKALCALLLTMVLIWGGLLPGFLHGYNPLFLTAVIAIIATVVTLLIVGGRSLKSITAIVGTLSGVAVAGGLALVVGKAAYLTGFGSEEAAMLLYIPQAAKLDIQGLLFAGIIIGALGASMDVSMSIASAVEEVKRVCPELGIWKLFQSGMNVGRDVMGTMVNTLILAYTGSSLQLILIFMAYRETLLKIFNLDAIASEVVRALSGSIGMIMVIPLTSIVAAILYGRNKPQGSEVEDAAVKEVNGR